MAGFGCKRQMSEPPVGRAGQPTRPPLQRLLTPGAMHNARLRWQELCPHRFGWVQFGLFSLFSSMAFAQQQAVIGADTPVDVRPIAPPVQVFPYPTWMVVTAGVVIVAVLALVAWLIVRSIRNRPPPVPPTPREIATAALRRLRDKLEATAPYDFSVEVSDVLRTFVSKQFGLVATQQTSPEFLSGVAQNAKFSESDKALLAAFLEKCDLIKFARMHATMADSERLLEQAMRFVEGGEKTTP